MDDVRGEAAPAIWNPNAAVRAIIGYFLLATAVVFAVLSLRGG